MICRDTAMHWFCCQSAEDTSQFTTVVARSPLPKDEAVAGEPVPNDYPKQHCQIEGNRDAEQEGQVENNDFSEHEGPAEEEDCTKQEGQIEDIEDTKQGGQVDEFEVEIEKEADGPIGMDIFLKDDYAIVKLIPPGPVSTWNAWAEESTRIREGDRVVQVNEVRGSSHALFAELQRVRPATQVTLQLQRREEVRLSLDIGQGLIGLDVNCHRSHESLIIKNIAEGVLKTWNDNNESNAINIGDRIVEVNGIRGQPKDLLEALRSAEHLEIVFVRFP